MGIEKKCIGIICGSEELFLSLKRALGLSFPEIVFYFYDTGLAEKGNLDKVKLPGFKKEGVLIALFTHDEENLKVCRFIKYLRIKRRLQFSLIFSSFLGEDKLRERYGILRYGGSQYCPLPIEIAKLVESVSSVSEMSDGHFSNFCKEYSEKHRIYFNKIILTLFKQVKKIRKEEFIERLEKIISELINNTPVTCHEKIKHKGKIENLAWHLNSEINNLKLLNEKLTVEIFSDLKELLDYWYKIVMDKNFE